MTLSAYQLKLIRDSAEDVQELSDTISSQFYEDLFSIAPCARGLFPEDMSAQRTKFAVMVRDLAEYAQNPERFGRHVQALGISHRAYGAAPETYELVSSVLLKTFAHVLSVIWTDELKQAWGEVISNISNEMLEAQLRVA